MAGRTGHPSQASISAVMAGDEQIYAVYEHFDPLIGETRATVAALPASGNWVGRLIFVTADSTLRVCTALPGTWRVVNTLQDTAWENVPLASGITHEASNPLQFSRRSGVVYFRGRANPNGSNPIGTMPVGFRPDGNAGQANIFYGDASTPARLNIPTATGVITPTAALGALLSLPFSYVATSQ